MRRIMFGLAGGALALLVLGTVAFAAPLNDDIEDAQVVGTSWNLLTQNHDATLQDGEPTDCGNNLDETAWYVFTAPRDGVVTIKRNGGGSTGAILIVRKDVVIDRHIPDPEDPEDFVKPVDFGTKVKCGFMSQGVSISFPVEGGETYYYQSGNQNGTHGGARLTGSFR